MTAGTGGSGSFTAGELVKSGAFFGAARLGLRNRPPNLPVLDFLPSPSVISVSEVVSGFFSRRFRLLKKERRFSGPGGGVVVVVAPVTGEVSVTSAAGVAVTGSIGEVVLGSSI